MLEGPITAVLVSSGLLRTLGNMEAVKTWAVFLMCFVTSAAGVLLSFAVFGGTLSGFRTWGVSIIVAVGMLSLNYGQKYVKLESRNSFSPIDLISYLLQGFLWPSTWPTLAHALGITGTVTGPVAPAGKTTGSSMLDSVISLFS